jgi:hypothetical protein
LINYKLNIKNVLNKVVFMDYFIKNINVLIISVKVHIKTQLIELKVINQMLNKTYNYLFINRLLYNPLIIMI